MSPEIPTPDYNHIFDIIYSSVKLFSFYDEDQVFIIYLLKVYDTWEALIQLLYLE